LSVCHPLDGIQVRLEPGQTVIPHGADRDLTVAVYSSLTPSGIELALG
jgi:hypothetical protein